MTGGADRRSAGRRAAASRENGKKGGRPRKDRGVEDFAEMGEAPRNPVGIAHWMQRVLAVDAWRIARGRAHEEMSQELRAYAHAMSQLLRPVIILAAADPDGAWWREASPEERPGEDPAAVAYWLVLQLAAGVLRCVRGEAGEGAELRATVAAYVKTLPPDTLHEAQLAILGEIEAMAGEGGPEARAAEVPDDDDAQRFQALSC